MSQGIAWRLFEYATFQHQTDQVDYVDMSTDLQHHFHLGEESVQMMFGRVFIAG